MAGIQSTVLRLERQIQQENARALTALHQQYDALAEAVLQAARGRGYLGNDPLGAIGDLMMPPATGRQVGESALELWRTFFACFRPDEAAFEAVKFREQAAAFEARIAALGPGEVPDLQLASELLAALAELWHARHQTINERIDHLITDLSQHQAELGSAKLETAHSEDEIKRAVDVVDIALKAAGVPPQPNEPLAQQIQRLLTRYRDDLVKNRKRSQETIAALGTFIAAIRAVALDQTSPPLPPEAEAVVNDVRKLNQARRDLETALREARTSLASVEAQRRELMEEVASRDRRLERLDRHEDAAQVDERLKLYRAAFAALEGGGDWKTPLEQARTLERVISLQAPESETAVKILDRQLGELARSLEALRKLSDLAEDPRRFRPRWFGAKYDFKSLPSLVQATRDAGRDLLAYCERMRWAVGVQVLARQAPKLRAVFKELVGLVADWREKLGDPPPVSLSVRMDGGSGILALPAIVAADLDTILRRKAKAALPASDLAPILEECVELYRKTLIDAKGGDAARVEKPKRESHVQACSRLAQELTQLAGACETAFAESARHDFKLDEEDARLMGEEHLARVALTHLDGSCGELAALPNAPSQKFTHPPAKKDFDRLLACARERAEYLELMARYRFQLAAAGAG
jgi:uncharacterized coiled-coil DUF342 family protein